MRHTSGIVSCWLLAVGASGPHPSSSSATSHWQRPLATALAFDMPEAKISEIIGFLAVFAILDIDLRRLILNMRAFLEWPRRDADSSHPFPRWDECF
jgi:hypothetical protein